jgi:hypothetical protein
LRREKAGGDRTKGLPQDLEYLRHLRAEHAASEYLIPFRFVRVTTDGFIQRHALDPVYSHSLIPLARLELRAAPRERDDPLRAWGGLPNAAQPRDLPTSPQRTPSFAHFQVFTPFLSSPPPSHC